jgi:class 3 adenylate cyclase/tetratricopeptide (TPR) repeat protein
VAGDRTSRRRSAPRPRPRCQACGGPLRATHRFCPNCGAAVSHASSLATPGGGPSLQVTARPGVDLSEDRRLATILFGDLSGSTTLGERLDPEELRQILSSFFSILAREIQRFGGTVDKYIGDAVMAVFGAPLAHEDDAERAINAAMAMQAAIEHLNDSLESRHGTRLALRIGINTGEVVAGLLSSDVQSAYTVVGDAVNTAQRFEAAAEPGTILVGQGTRDLARRTFDFEQLPPLAMRGKADPQAAFRVIGVRIEPTNRSELPLIARAEEMERLRVALTAASRGEGGCIHLVGEAGIGKSRLVRELRSNLPPAIFQVVGRCVSFETGQPYALLSRLLHDIVRVPRGQNISAARRGIESVLDGLGASIDALESSLLLDVMGYGERSAIDPQSGQRVLLRVLRRMLAAYTARAPLLIVVEDVHWADSASTALLTEVALEIPPRRCLMLSTSRPGSPPGWRADIIALEALSPAGARSVVDAAFGAPVDDVLADAILTRTGGNPFFIEEVVRGLREANVLTVSEGRVAARAGHTPPVPATVQEVLEARLDRLPPRPKRILQIAAVCGRVFRRRVIDRLAPGAGVVAGLTTLERESFISALAQPLYGDATYAFQHALIQEVAYNRQLQAQRRTTHAAIGEALETVYPDRLEELVGELAFHFAQSDRDDKACYWLVRAGNRARALFANTEALAQYHAALERASDGPGPFDTGAILEAIGDVQTLIGKYEEAIAGFRSAQARTPWLDAPGLARLHRKIGSAYLLKGAYRQATEELESGVAALGSADDLEAARLQVQIGHLHYRRGEFAAARAALTMGADVGARFEADDLVADAFKWLGTVAIATGDLKTAADFYQRSRHMYEVQEQLAGIAEVRGNLGMVYRRMARWEAALAEYDASLALRERIGNTWGVATCHNNIGEVHRSTGDLPNAILSYERALALFESIGAATEAAITLTGAGAARVEAGDLVRGRDDLVRALDRLSALGSGGYLPDVYRYLASADLALGNVEQAEHHAKRSLEQARAGSAPHQEAATMRVLAEIALARGERDSAEALLEVSRETLSRLGDSQELAKTEAVLQHLRDRQGSCYK